MSLRRRGRRVGGRYVDNIGSQNNRTGADRFAEGYTWQATAPHDAAKVVENSAALGKALKAAGGVVVLVKVAFANDYADTPGKEVDEPAPMPPGGLPAEWSEFVPEIHSLQADVVITKRQWSAF